MNVIASLLKNLDRKQKLAFIIFSDFVLALICWLVFGPPMATYIASEFSSNVLDILYLVSSIHYLNSDIETLS